MFRIYSCTIKEGIVYYVDNYLYDFNSMKVHTLIMYICVCVFVGLFVCMRLLRVKYILNLHSKRRFRLIYIRSETKFHVHALLRY